MEIMIELSELSELSDAELDEVVGGAGSASFSFTNTASGTTASVAGAIFNATLPSAATQFGGFASSST